MVAATASGGPQHGATPRSGPDAGRPQAQAGRLPPPVIQSEVRSHFGQVRACYEDGLKRDPKLAGKVTACFVIEKDGAVGAHKVAGPAEDPGTIPDPVVRDCIDKVLATLRFPAPQGGIVSVVYPILLSPGDGPPGAGSAPAGAPSRGAGGP
ncbi:AgmX/PglI C-terminal domain-containing protein [Sorangium cellulosum]|nr:AgmX/PglI C-terminal domain-containing protein [Sorangium cellulosum]